MRAASRDGASLPRPNPINTVDVDTRDAWLGIIAGGKTYADLRQTLRDIGLDEQPDADTALRRAGIRLLRLGMIHPLEHDKVRAFATGLEALPVVEEKGPFLERAVRDVCSTACPVHLSCWAQPLRRVLRGRVELAPAPSSIGTSGLTRCW